MNRAPVTSLIALLFTACLAKPAYYGAFTIVSSADGGGAIAEERVAAAVGIVGSVAEQFAMWPSEPSRDADASADGNSAYYDLAAFEGFYRTPPRKGLRGLDLTLRLLRRRDGGALRIVLRDRRNAGDSQIAERVEGVLRARLRQELPGMMVGFETGSAAR